MPQPKLSPPSKEIRLNHTIGEWQYLEELIKREKKCDLHNYLNREISRLKTKNEECPLCISPADGRKKSRKHRVPSEIYQGILQLSARMGKTPGTIIDEFILNPLLPKGKDPAL